MLKLLSYLIKQGVATATNICPPLDAACLGLPKVTESPCEGTSCNACTEACPTNAITVIGDGESAALALDLGACIGCGLCIDLCPTGTIQKNLSTRTAVQKREDLILTNNKQAPGILNTVNPDLRTGAPQSEGTEGSAPAKAPPLVPKDMFKQSLAVRVVSTGCSACDAELGAAGNPIFDIDRFGVSIVASPRYADALMVTGPVGKGMQKALLRCYEAMAEPRAVIAAGTCAISGGVHRGGYAEANGVDAVLPVDVYIPGCPPHPWSMIYGALLGMGSTDRLK